MLRAALNFTPDNMKLLALTAAFAGALVAPATATVIYFSGSSPTDGPDGNTRVFSEDGVTVTASADSTSDGGGSWDAAYLGLYSNGLGVTNSGEGSGSSGRHTVDNSGWVDRVTFAFSSPVIFDRVYLSAYGDTDISVGYYSGGSWTFLEDNYGSSSSRWANVNSGEIVSDTWTVSALLPANGKADKFKIKKIDFEEVTTVPDGGASIALLGLGLGSMFSMRALRRKA